MTPRLALSVMVLAARVVTAQSAAPPLGVAIISDRPGAQTMSETVAGQVHRALVREGAPDAVEAPAVSAQAREIGAAEPRSCKGMRSCAQNLAVLLGEKAMLITVDVGKLGATVVVRLEALQAGSEKPLEVSELTVDADGVGEKTAVPVTQFVRRVLQKRAPAATGGMVIEPWVEPYPTPPPPPQVVEPVTSQEAPKPSRAPAVVATAVTAALAVAAVGFLVNGLEAKGQYDRAREGMGSTLTLAQANALASRANVSFTVALAAGGAAAAGGVITGLLWAW
jgi:hypothetical protein